MLKTIIDETSHGKYDFMYLRIGKKPMQTYELPAEKSNEIQILPTIAS